jgi:hypothetical protein
MKVLHFEVYGCCSQKLLLHSNSKYGLEEFDVPSNHLGRDFKATDFWHDDGDEHYKV